jgi:hypothetical protein
MYLKVLEHSVGKITRVIENHFSLYMEKYEAAPNKEEHLKDMFISIFAEPDK